MNALRRHSARWPILFAVALAAAALVVAWAVWLRGGGEPENVTVFQGDRHIGTATPEEALRMVADIVGFRPAAPEHLPGEDLRLMTARAYLPEDGDAEVPRSHLTFGFPYAEPEDVVIVLQGRAPTTGAGEDVRRLPIDIDGVTAWAHWPEDVAGGEFRVQAGDMWVYVVSGPPLSDAEATTMLRSIAEQLE